LNRIAAIIGTTVGIAFGVLRGAMTGTDQLAPLWKVSTCPEYAIACMFEQRGDRGSWTFWFERWIGTGTYWLCHQGYMPGAFRVA
jgi:hypothetical protein